MLISTPYGNFSTHRKNTVAVTVIRIKRSIIHRRKERSAGEYDIIEHRKFPVSISGTECWAERIESYDLKGQKLEYPVSNDLYMKSYSPNNLKTIELLCKMVKKADKSRIPIVNELQKIIKARGHVLYGEYLLLRNYIDELIPVKKTGNWLIDQGRQILKDVRDWPSWMRSDTY